MNHHPLLIPRYKVEGNYPGSPYKIGDMLVSLGENRFDLYKDGATYYNESELKKYPHLFRLMDWWEGRKKKDLPEYVSIRGVFLKVDKWDAKNSENTWAHISKKCYYSNICTPATIDEYNEYLSSIKNKKA